MLKPSLNTDQPVCIIATTLTFKQYAAEIEKKTLAPGLAREIFHRDVPPGAKFQFMVTFMVTFTQCSWGYNTLYHGIFQQHFLIYLKMGYLWFPKWLC